MLNEHPCDHPCIPASVPFKLYTHDYLCAKNDERERDVLFPATVSDFPALKTFTGGDAIQKDRTAKESGQSAHVGRKLQRQTNFAFFFRTEGVCWDN